MPLISRTIAGLSAPKRQVKQIIELSGGSMYILNLFLVFKVVAPQLCFEHISEMLYIFHCFVLICCFKTLCGYYTYQKPYNFVYRANTYILFLKNKKTYGCYTLTHKQRFAYLLVFKVVTLQLLTSPHLYWRIKIIPLRMHDPDRILHMTVP